MNSLLELDKKIFQWLHKLVGKNAALDSFWKITSVYLVYTLPVFLVLLWFFSPGSREASIRGTFVGTLGWLILTRLISKIWYRPRPFAEALNTKEVVFHRPDYSFPSDHAIFAFAIAAGFGFAGDANLAIAFYVAAFVISITRVIVGVHYLLDCIVGALIGIGLAYLAVHYKANFDPIVVKPILTIAKFLHMA